MNLDEYKTEKVFFAHNRGLKSFFCECEPKHKKKIEAKLELKRVRREFLSRFRFEILHFSVFTQREQQTFCVRVDLPIK